MNNFPPQEPYPGEYPSEQPLAQYPEQPQPAPQQPGYSSGYQPQPMPYPPQPMQPQTPQMVYPQQPMMGYPQQMVYPQPMMMPYPQQMVMAPQMNVNVNIGAQKPQQVSMPIRIIYFICIGSWLGMLWLGVALGFMMTIVGIPIGLMMLNRLGTVMTLSQR
jgi:Inner membrane component domain